MSKKSFKDFYYENVEKDNILFKKIKLFEHKIYNTIPKTNASYREDTGKLNLNIIKHAHIYAKPNGKGEQLYSVNIDGSGHDGSSGVSIPKKHANYFRSIGYEINSENIIESLLLNDINKNGYELLILSD